MPATARISSAPAGAPATIDRHERLDPDRFRDEYYRPGRPVLITGMATEWPAYAKWSFAYFRELAGAESDVVVEHGNVLQNRTRLSTDSLRDYIDTVVLAPAGGGGAGVKRYASLLQIFAIFPQLAADVDFSLLTRLTRWHYTFGWIGPAGTVAGFHIDWIQNILAQIHGTKKVSLVPPHQSAGMYPSRKYDLRSTLSAIEPTRWDPARHPLFAQVQPLETTLEAGQMLFIPRGWWHRVEALTPSISVNTFAHDLNGFVRDQLPALAQKGLHRLGLWGRGNCTCHQARA